MKIVSISLDPKILDPSSRVSARNLLYGEVVNGYSVVIHSKKDSISERPHSVTVYGVGGAYKFVRFFRIVWFIRKLIKEKKCDVIASSDPYFIGFATLLLARLYNVGFELQILGIEKYTFLRKKLTRFIIKRAGSIRVNSVHLQNRIVFDFSLDKSDILFVPTYYISGTLGFSGILPSSAEAEEQQELQQKFRSSFSGMCNVLTVGRLVSVKNVALQIQAVRKLKDKQQNVHLHIVGIGPEEKKLRQLAGAEGVSEFVTFHGELKGLALGVLYTESDMFLLTSYIEGWPMVIFDAIVAKLPIVMTDVGCAGEFILNEKNGLVIPVDDTDALVQSIVRLKNERPLSEKLTETAMVHFENYWSLDRILSGYKQSWEKAAAKAKK